MVQAASPSGDALDLPTPKRAAASSELQTVPISDLQNLPTKILGVTQLIKIS
jgi:hypothetical protein